MPDFGRFLVILGVLVALVGLLLMLGPRSGAPLSWIGRLPGDFMIERRGFKAFFPLGTCIVVSIVLTLLLHVFRR